MKANKWILLLTLLFTVSCNQMKSADQQVDKDFNAEVIYGADNRIDAYQILDIEWRKLTNSTMAIIDRRRLTLNDEGDQYSIDFETFGKSFNLCPDETFYEQPSAAFCSAFLVGPQIAITAGHCIRNNFNCENARFAFDYSYESLDIPPTTVAAKNVYNCKEVIHTQANALTGADYAIIRLDRQVKDRKPVLVRRSGQLSTEDQLTVIGYPSGLPVKLADQGIIRDNSYENYFVATLDTYGGNSGSAVFNSHTRLVEGILVRGDTDFVYDQKSKCRRSNVCKQAECRGEDVVRIDVILDHLSPQELLPLPEQEAEEN